MEKQRRINPLTDMQLDAHNWKCRIVPSISQWHELEVQKQGNFRLCS